MVASTSGKLSIFLSLLKSIWRSPLFREAVCLDTEEHHYGNGVFSIQTYHLGCNQVIILTENIIITSDEKFYI